MALSPEHAQMSATELRVGTPDILPVDMQPISKETPAHSKIPVSAPGAAEVVEEPCPDADHLTQATSKSLTSEKRKASDDACKEQAKKHKGMENQDVRTVQDSDDDDSSSNESDDDDTSSSSSSSSSSDESDDDYSGVLGRHVESSDDDTPLVKMAAPKAPKLAGGNRAKPSVAEAQMFDGPRYPGLPGSLEYERAAAEVFFQHAAEVRQQAKLQMQLYANAAQAVALRTRAWKDYYRGLQTARELGLTMPVPAFPPTLTMPALPDFSGLLGSLQPYRPAWYADSGVRTIPGTAGIASRKLNAEALTEESRTHNASASGSGHIDSGESDSHSL